MFTIENNMNKKELRTELGTQTKLWIQWLEIESWKQIEKPLIWILEFLYSRQSGESVKLIEKLLKWQLRGDGESDNSDCDNQTVLKEDDHTWGFLYSKLQAARISVATGHLYCFLYHLLFYLQLKSMNGKNWMLFNTRHPGSGLDLLSGETASFWCWFINKLVLENEWC